MMEVGDYNPDTAQAKRVIDKLHDLQRQFDKDEVTIEKLRKSAVTKTKMFTWLSSSVVVGQFALITVGTFHYLSWDIMEPISYLMMLGNFTTGFWFYTIAKKDLALENVTDILNYRFTQSAARRHGIDLD